MSEDNINTAPTEAADPAAPNNADMESARITDAELQAAVEADNAAMAASAASEPAAAPEQETAAARDVTPIATEAEIHPAFASAAAETAAALDRDTLLAAAEAAERARAEQQVFTVGEEKSDRISKSIRRMMQVVTAVCLLPVVLSWGLLAYSLYTGRRDALDRASAETLELAELFREHAEKNIATADFLTAMIKDGIESGDLTSMRGLASRRFISGPYSLYYIDENGKLRSGTYGGGDSNLQEVYAEHISIHRAIDSSAIYIGRSVWDKWARHWTFAISRRVNKGDGSYGGVIVFTLNPQQFFDYYSHQEALKDIKLMLVGRDLIIRAVRSGHSDFIDNSISDPVVAPRIVEGDQGTFIATGTIDEDPYIYSYTTLNRYPLIVVTGRSKSSALVDFGTRATFYGIIAIICMASGFVLWRILIRLLAKQHETESNLRNVQDHLKQTIDERTAELVSANTTLTETNNSLASLNRDLGDEIERRRQAEEESRAAEEKLRYTAYHDLITDLANRAAAVKFIDDAIAAGNPGLIIHVYLNEIRDINDAFGYETGNEVIRAVGRVLSDKDAGLTDAAVIAHLGLGRFAIVIPGATTPKQTEVMANCITAAIDKINDVHSLRLHLASTYGIAFYPEHGNNAAELMRNADNAVFAARKQKADWLIYTPQMTADILERVTMTSNLRQAILHNEFLLVYQPKISAISGRVKGFEALVRWHSPTLGLVRPDKFISLAEQNGLISAIDRWVLKEACRFSRRLAAAGWRDITIAVNVSGVQFAQENFIEEVKASIEETDVSPSVIELEVTETALIAPVEAAIAKLAALRDFGLKVALDDFGVSYSTLSYLMRLPFDTLKIDKSFIDTINKEGHGAEIVRMIIGLAHLMGKEVVAEGVETRDQNELLAQMNCDLIQGYYYSQPLNEINAFEYLRREEKWTI